MNNDLTSRDGNDDHRRYIPRLLDDVVSGVVGTTAFVTQHAEPVSPIETYETFDRRDGGWLETVRTVDRIGAQGWDNGNAHSPNGGRPTWRSRQRCGTSSGRRST